MPQFLLPYPAPGGIKYLPALAVRIADATGDANMCPSYSHVKIISAFPKAKYKYIVDIGYPNPFSNAKGPKY